MKMHVLILILLLENFHGANLPFYFERRDAALEIIAHEPVLQNAFKMLEGGKAVSIPERNSALEVLFNSTSEDVVILAFSMVPSAGLTYWEDQELKKPFQSFAIAKALIMASASDRRFAPDDGEFALHMLIRRLSGTLQGSLFQEMGSSFPPIEDTSIDGVREWLKHCLQAAKDLRAPTVELENAISRLDPVVQEFLKIGAISGTGLVDVPAPGVNAKPASPTETIIPERSISSIMAPAEARPLKHCQILAGIVFFVISIFLFFRASRQ